MSGSPAIGMRAPEPAFRNSSSPSWIAPLTSSRVSSPPVTYQGRSGHRRVASTPYVPCRSTGRDGPVVATLDTARSTHHSAVLVPRSRSAVRLPRQLGDRRSPSVPRKRDRQRAARHVLGEGYSRVAEHADQNEKDQPSQGAAVHHLLPSHPNSQSIVRQEDTIR